MDAEQFIPVLGLTDDSPAVAKLLSDLGVKKKPRIKSDEDDVMVELTKRGLVLVFERADEPKTSKIKLAEVQFYSDKEEGYTSFAGKLPRDLTFEDTQSTARKKMGAPDESKAEFRLETWRIGRHELTVEYSKDDGRIQSVQLGLPV